MSQRFRIAALQPTLRWQQPMSNMFTLRKMVEDLPSNIDVVMLPEMWPGLPHGTDLERKSTQCAQFLQTLARTRRINVVGGSFERVTPGCGRQNICLVVNREGQIVGEYAKRMLFGREQDAFVPGTEPGIVELEGSRLGVLICADVWNPDLVRELAERVDVVCVAAKTSVPSDNHVEYARTLWHGLALTRAMENGLPIAVSDWPAGRHAPKDIDASLGSVHAPGMEYDRGVLHRWPGDPDVAPTARGPVEPTATAHTSATPALGAGVHFTAGATTICNPAHRPDIHKIQRILQRGEPGFLVEEIDLAAVQRYREYRCSQGLLPKRAGEQQGV